MIVTITDDFTEIIPEQGMELYNILTNERADKITVSNINKNDCPLLVPLIKISYL